MFDLVESYRSGSENQKDFCQHHGIKQSTFSYWVTRYKKSQANNKESSSFIRINATKTLAPSSSQQILFPNGVEIRGNFNNVTPSFTELMIRLGQVRL
jgi:transposase-like protein